MAIVEARSYSVQDVLKAQLNIPLYQRPYVWNDDSARKLLDDILESFKNREPGLDEGYFIGNILLIKNEDGDDSFDLADGQQRLTTLFILLGQLQAKVLAKKSTDYHSDASFVRDFILAHRVGPHDIRTAIRSPHVEVQSLLNRLALGEVLTTPAARATKNIGARLVRAYTHISGLIHEWLLDAEAKEKLNLGLFLTYVRDKVELVAIKYPNTSVALEFFESLNSTGTKLIQADLLKSAFMKQVPSSKWEAVDEHWTEILQVVGNKKDGEDSFLRTASMAVLFPAFAKSMDAPKKNELLKRILLHCKDNHVEVDVLMAKMSRFAKNREALFSESPVYPGGVSGRVIVRLRRLPKLPDFAVTMLSVIPDELSIEAKERLATTLEALICVIAISRESKNINYAVQPFCVRLRDLKESEVSYFCADLMAALIRPNLRIFYSQFKNMDSVGKHKSWVRYFLWVVEDYLRSGLGCTLLDYSDKLRGARKAHIEHIIPQSSIEIKAEIIQKIGNLTLLEPSKNTSLGAVDYLTKRAQYASSEFRITAELAAHAHGDKTSARAFLDSSIVRPLWDFPTFDPSDVELRTEGIYELLLSYWGVNAEAPPKTIVEPAEVLPTRSPAVSTAGLGVKTGITSCIGPDLGSLKGKAIDVGSKVTFLYGDKEYTYRIVETSYASRNGELLLNVQKEGKDLLGLRVGDVIESQLFNLTPSRIEILKVD